MGTNFPSGVLSYGVPVESLALSLSPYGDVWYVDTTNGSDTANDGKAPDRAFATLDKARSSSAAGDIIIIAPGTYTQTAAAQPLTPKARQVWIAAVQGYKPTVIITGTAEAVVVDVDVAGVSFIGIQFQADVDGVNQLVRVANTVAVSGLNFIGCWFDGNNKTSVDGVSSVHATLAVTGLLVRGCRFKDIDNGIIIGVSGMPLALIEGNVFEVRAAADGGLNLADTTAYLTGFGYVIRNNDFIGGVGATAVGIIIAGTEDTTGGGIIRNNFFAFCAAGAITPDKVSRGMANNYVGDVGTGGTLVDSGTA